MTCHFQLILISCMVYKPHHHPTIEAEFQHRETEFLRARGVHFYLCENLSDMATKAMLETPGNIPHTSIQISNTS